MKTVSLLAAALIGVTALSCSGPRDGTVRAADLVVYAPLPGSTTAVAYLTVHNDTAAGLTISSASSPQFERVELHESRLDDGVSRMSPLAEVRVPPGGQAAFEAGGRHIMLLGPLTAVTAGTAVTLRLHGPDGPLLQLDTVMRDRNGDPEAARVGDR